MRSRKRWDSRAGTKAMRVLTWPVGALVSVVLNAYLAWERSWSSWHRSPRMTVRERITAKSVDVIMWTALVLVFASIELREWWRALRKRPVLSGKGE